MFELAGLPGLEKKVAGDHIHPLPSKDNWMNN
jgi:hypothetical protein